MIHLSARMQSLCYIQCLRRMWRQTQALQFLRSTNMHRSARQLQPDKAMEDHKPWALFSGVGVNGFLEDFVDIIHQHFHAISLEDFLLKPQLHGPKIQALLLWNNHPPVEPSLLSLLPSLKVITNAGVGIDHLDVPYLAGLGLKMANTPTVVGNATADMAMALLLASARKIVEGHQLAVHPKPPYCGLDIYGAEVTGSTLGILGMGSIGFKIAKRAKGFDMKILYHNRNRRSVEDEQEVGASYRENMDDLLKESDFVVLAVSLTPETRGLISRRELTAMKPTATLINISRGPVVDQDALVEALQSGTIQAAALDVTYPEPLPRNHPLLSLPNVLITPHLGTNTIATSRRMVQDSVESALAALKGQPIPNEVKPK
ncbi:glyoxylate/hydroxypyruvate reductase B [Antennarius striatus]|uniref:glyoxylate/hydroxypyruvate reductase B n=1 Tax=Antennarius striatus TaxID=241820 RepID=UPI0035B0CA85